MLELLKRAIGVSFMLRERVNDAGAHFQRGLEIGKLLKNPRSNALGLDCFRDAGDR